MVTRIDSDGLINSQEIPVEQALPEAAVNLVTTRGNSFGEEYECKVPLQGGNTMHVHFYNPHKFTDAKRKRGLDVPPENAQAFVDIALNDPDGGAHKHFPQMNVRFVRGGAQGKWEIVFARVQMTSTDGSGNGITPTTVQPNGRPITMADVRIKIPDIDAKLQQLLNVVDSTRVSADEHTIQNEKERVQNNIGDLGIAL